MTVHLALAKTEARLTAEVRRAYGELRHHTDPRGHDLLAVLEREHLRGIAAKYEYVRQAIQPVGGALRLVTKGDE